MTILFLLLGLFLAAVGGDRFVRGSVGLASWLGIPAGIIGATIAAFATSSPELTVGIVSAVDGHSELAFGDATGSNLMNLSVVFGLTLMIGSITLRWADIRREVLTFAASLAILALTSLDGRIDRREAIGMVVIFILWLMWIVREVRRQRSDVEILGDVDHRSIIMDVVVGLVLLVVAGRLIVLGGKEIGEILGWSEFVVGTLIVSVGTSAPELVTTVIAARRGHVGVGVGTVLGSNIFNSLFIVGVSGAIDPIDVEPTPTSIALGTAAIATAVLIPCSRQRLGRVRGLVLLSIYGIFLVLLLLVRAT